MKNSTIQKILSWVAWIVEKLKKMFSEGDEQFRKEADQKDQEVVEELVVEKEQIEQEYEERKPKEGENMAEWWTKWGERK